MISSSFGISFSSPRDSKRDEADEKRVLLAS